jgi:hypothetical protein
MTRGQNDRVRNERGRIVGNPLYLCTTNSAREQGRCATYQKYSNNYKSPGSVGLAHSMDRYVIFRKVNVRLELCKL